MVVVDSNRQLLEIVLALRPASSLASLLYSRKQQSHQNGNDGNHHQKFDQGKTTLTHRPVSAPEKNCTVKRLSVNLSGLARGFPGKRRQEWQNSSNQYVEQESRKNPTDSGNLIAFHRR
jgi:hypothetical protein